MPIPLRRWLSFIKLSSFHIFVIEVLVHPSSLNIFSISSRSGAAYFSCSAARWYSACVKLCYSFSFFVRWVVCFSRKENSITLVNQTYYREKKTHMDVYTYTRRSMNRCEVDHEIPQCKFPDIPVLTFGGFFNKPGYHIVLFKIGRGLAPTWQQHKSKKPKK